MTDPLTEALDVIRRHAEVCSRYGEGQRLRDAADRIEARASGEGTAPQPAPSELAREFCRDREHDSITWAGQPCSDCREEAELVLVYLRRIAERGTAPQVPAEVVRELIEAHDAVEEGLVSFDLHNAAVTRLEAAWAAVRAALAGGGTAQPDPPKPLAYGQFQERRLPNPADPSPAHVVLHVYEGQENLHIDGEYAIYRRTDGPRGTAPQVPAEEVRDEIESLRMTLAELDSEHAASSRVASALAAAIGWETPGELWVDKARHLAPLAAELEAARELRAARNGETTKEHRPAEAVHPGEMLQDELEERGMTQASLAEALGHASPATVSRLCNGRADMNAATALGLERALGTSAELWLRLQMAYDLHHARVRVVAADGAPQEGDER